MKTIIKVIALKRMGRMSSFSSSTSTGMIQTKVVLLPWQRCHVGAASPPAAALCASSG